MRLRHKIFYKKCYNLKKEKKKKDDNYMTKKNCTFVA